MFQFHQLKIAITFFCLAVFFIPQIKASNQSVLADNSRSDSVDVIDYNIHLNVTDYAGKTINGNCTVSFKSKINNLTQLDLDLQKLTIDSIIQNNQKISFTYNDQLTMHVALLSALNAGDSTAVTVFYHGTPTNDTGGFGGWYWSGDYSFSISVALNNIPHNYGRSWFPCVDNFVERSTYHFSVITTTDKMALCNGELILSVDNGDGTKTWNWELLQTIPAYLACVAVNKYTPAYGIYYGVDDTIPIQYGAIASDTTKMKNSFINLSDAMDVFVEKFGAYRWNKIGYCETTVGAMEHATNIAYPYFIVNGQTTYENIMAHELAHNWFGNLVTCRTAEDMWLNEGWAEYGSYVFYEKVYGKEKYNTTVAANHESVVHYAHTTIKDGAYYAVGNVPETKTYGTTVYYKGADMAHTLRGYMGDSLFFSCIKNYLDAFAFKDASSYDFRDYLTSCSGIDLTNFFDDWIFQPGWAAFTIDSFNVEEGQPGVFNTNVFLRQRLDHAQNFYNEVPLELSFYDEERNVTTETAFISGNCAEFSITLPFSPVYVGLDLDEKISDAQTADLKTIKNIGAINFVNGKMNLTVNSISDSVLLRIEHVYAAPDPFVYPIPKLHISQERFWKVDGIIPDGFDATSIISYSGATTTGGFLDNNLITNSEDSMVLLYKEIPAHDWQIETDAVQNVLVSHSDKKGNFTINHLKKGYYTFGIYQNNKIDSVINFGNYPCQVVGVPAIPFSNKMELNVFPNPADESITIDIENSSVNNLLEIYNLYGMRVFSSTLRSKQQILSVKNWHRGTYLLKISDHNNRQVAAQIFIVN